MLRQQRHFSEQRALLEARNASCPGSVVLKNALAYLLSSVPEASLRDGPRALRLAKAVVEETQGKHPDYLDTLAAAYAEVGDFERAVAEQKRALALLEEGSFPPQIVASFEQHLASFEAGEPIREP
jgi:CHASE2 domain-containing sensor protein